MDVIGNFKLDYSISNTSDRIRYVIDEGLLKFAIDYNWSSKQLLLKGGKIVDVKSKKTPNLGENPFMESITTYIFRSKDIGSGLKEDYKYFMDSISFYNSERNAIGLDALYSDDVVEGIALSEKHISEIFYKLPTSDKIQALKYSSSFKPNNNDVYDLDRFISRKEIYCYIKNYFYNNASDDIDITIIDKYSEGYNIQEISEVLGVSFQAISKRLNKIANNG